MTTVKIREKVFEYINHADDRILKAVYAMLKEYEDSPAQKSVLTDEQYKEMERRLRNHKNGNSKSYSMDEVKLHIKKKLLK
jgi:hypothetical protein